MNYISLLKLSPNIYNRAKIWEFEINKVLFFGSKNASGRLRFTDNSPYTVRIDSFDY